MSHCIDHSQEFRCYSKSNGNALRSFKLGNATCFFLKKNTLTSMRRTMVRGGAKGGA